MSPNKDTVGLHTFMQNRRTLFCYSGPMTEDLLTTIANPVRHQLSDKETEEASQIEFLVFSSSKLKISLGILIRKPSLLAIA